MPVANGEARDMVPSPARGQGDRWERWGRKSSPVTTVPTRTSRVASGFGYAAGLSCRECGKVYPLGPHYACDECFGPLEVSSVKPLSTLTSCAPDAIGTTTCSGSRQPSCSAISKPSVLDPSA